MHRLPLSLWVFAMLLGSLKSEATSEFWLDTILSTPSGNLLSGELDIEVQLYSSAGGGDPILSAALSYPGQLVREGKLRLRLDLTEQDLARIAQTGGAALWAQILDARSDRVFPRVKVLAAALASASVDPMGTGSDTQLATSTATATLAGTNASDTSVMTATATATATATSERTISTATSSSVQAAVTVASTSTLTSSAVTSMLTASETFDAQRLPGSLSPGQQTWADVGAKFEHGTIGVCAAPGQLAHSGTQIFQRPFTQSPTVILTGQGPWPCQTPQLLAVEMQSFTWSAGAEIFGPRCACIHWLAIMGGSYYPTNIP